MDDEVREKARAAFAKAKEMMRLKKLAAKENSSSQQQQNNVDFSSNPPTNNISNNFQQNNEEWQNELNNIAQEFDTQEMKSDIAMTYNAETFENGGSFENENMSPREFVKTFPNADLQSAADWSFQEKEFTPVSKPKNKKQIIKEIKCQECSEVFPTKVLKSLHTCNSILDRNISEDGQDRLNRGGTFLKFAEKETTSGSLEEILKMEISKPTKPTAIVKPKRKRKFSEDSNTTSSSSSINSRDEKTGLKNNKKSKIEGKLKPKISKVSLFDKQKAEFSDEDDEEEEDFKTVKKTTIFIDSSQDDINCCEFCDKIFVSPNAYISHMNTEHKVNKKNCDGANKEEVKCCNLCGNIYITKESYVTHMKTDHSIFEMKKKISPSNGFDEYYDRKLPNKVNDELVETLKKVKNKPMPKSRKKILFSNAFEKSQEQQQQQQEYSESTNNINSNKGEHKFWLYEQIPIATSASGGSVNKNRKKSREIICQDCDEVFATKESKNLHTCNSILDRGALVDGKERKKQRVEREFSIDHDVFFDKKKPDVVMPRKTGTVSKSIKAYQCYLCAIVFVFKSNSKRHFRKIHPNDDYDITKIKNVNFKCYKCPQEFDYYESLEAHFEESHPNDKPLKPEKVQLGNTLTTAAKILSMRRKISSNYMISSSRPIIKPALTKFLPKNGVKENSNIVCQDCDEIFATKESKNLHTCNSILDRGALVDGQERKKQRVEREFLIDHDVFFDKKKHDVAIPKKNSKKVENPIENIPKKKKKKRSKSTFIENHPEPIVIEGNYREYRLPHGWLKRAYQRKDGNTKGKWDVHVIAPDGKKLRSNPEIEKYLQLYPEVAHDEQVTKTSPWPEDIYNIYMKSYQEVPEKKTETNNKIPIQDSNSNSNPNSKEHFA